MMGYVAQGTKGDAATFVSLKRGRSACNLTMLIPPSTHARMLVPQVKAMAKATDKVMVLLDSHHSEYHVTVGAGFGRGAAVGAGGRAGAAL